MGSRTNGNDVVRVRENLARLTRKLSAGKILTAEQHAYLDEKRKMFGDRLAKARKTLHRCRFCGTGGHTRGGAPINGVRL